VSRDNTNLEEEIYMEAPLSFNIPKGHVLRLKKGIYGTKQGGRVWYIEISDTLTEMGYTHTEADHAVFVHPSPDPTPNIITLYIDDMGQISESLDHILQNKAELSKHYQMTDLGEMS
jgi:hypothetical protein